jgi:DUF4097 and DUF4098 domain-containing protein YvlB
MTEQQPEEPQDLVRTQDFATSRPIEVDVVNHLGSIQVTLTATDHTRVEVRHDPASDYTDWRTGLSSLLNWVGEQFGDTGLAPGVQEQTRTMREPITEAVHQTRIDMTGNRLAVRTPTTAPLRNVPLAVTVVAPDDSQLNLHTGSGPVAVSGTAGRTQIQSGAGKVSLEEAAGNVTVRTGSGHLRLGSMTAGVQARSGSGDVEIGSVDSASSVVTGSGDIWLGAVSGDVLARSGSGDISIADAAGGQVELITGSGRVQVAVRRGVSAEIDLTSSTGTASSDLPIADEPQQDDTSLHLFGRTGSGDVLVTSAV